MIEMICYYVANFEMGEAAADFRGAGGGWFGWLGDGKTTHFVRRVIYFVLLRFFAY